MRQPVLVAEQFGRYVILDGTEIAHCSDEVAAELIVCGLNCLELTEGRVAHILELNAANRAFVAANPTLHP